MTAVLPILVLVASSAVSQAATPPGGTDLLASVGAGSDLKGWTRVPIPPNGTLKAPSPWSFDPGSGLLTCSGDRSGHEWLRWDQELKDGTFHVEFRFAPVEGKKGYNSGVYLRNSAEGRVWYQAQVGSASGGFLFGEMPDGDGVKSFNAQGGSKPHTVKPAGEWNTVEITAQGSELSLRVNGEDASVWHHCEPSHGFAGLEAEGWRIEFRHVTYRPLEVAK